MPWDPTYEELYKRFKNKYAPLEKYAPVPGVKFHAVETKDELVDLLVRYDKAHDENIRTIKWEDGIAKVELSLHTRSLAKLFMKFRCSHLSPIIATLNGEFVGSIFIEYYAPLDWNLIKWPYVPKGKRGEDISIGLYLAALAYAEDILKLNHVNAIADLDDKKLITFIRSWKPDNEEVAVCLGPRNLITFTIEIK